MKTEIGHFIMVNAIAAIQQCECCTARRPRFIVQVFTPAGTLDCWFVLN